ncbi:hypothetical protein SLS60_002584 [Paraconiothyrium brasiliense]|uniref:Actin-like ATPase domain-containing protein n=1 Tax=Paraconiothyrium brasiliense TaxID=300254 RepID=A0ABR3RU75_9PLEO
MLRKIRNKLKPLLNYHEVADLETCILDYLKNVWCFLKPHCEKKFGLGFNTRVHYIFTYPVRFQSHKLHTLQVKALKFAGMPTGPGRDCHDPNDVITNVDQGGHTFDITTAKLRHTSPLRVCEDVIPEEGTIYGMQAIKDNLRELLKVKVTKKPAYGSLEDRFDKLEKNFRAACEESNLRSIFKPVIDRAVMFITSHLDKVVTKTGRASDYFILTGGGGSCWPMRDAIWKALNQRYPKTRLVDAISKPDSVASGAILQVLDASYDEERVFNLNLCIRWKVPRGPQAKYYLTPEDLASLKGKKGVYHVEEDNYQYYDLLRRFAEKGCSDTSTRRGGARATARTPDRESVSLSTGSSNCMKANHVE